MAPSRDPRRREVLIATLGTRPEVITLALDLLLQDYPIDHVVVIHTARSFMPIGRALLRLEKEFPGRSRYAHAGIPCTCETVELKVDGQPFEDIATKEQAGAAFTAIYRQVQKHKQAGHRIHLSIAGGRKSMSVYGMAVAQLLFDAEDRLWHILSHPTFEESDAMHTDRPEDVQLVRIPVLPYTYFVPALPALLIAEDPMSAVERQQNLLTLEQRKRRHEFLTSELTAAEYRLVETLMREILLENRTPTYEQLGRRLIIAPKTVEHALGSIYGKLRALLGVEEA
ncbi:MAG: CRISPR-associated ring nuclease, partial [Anaerolineae bacterium]